MNDNWYKKNLSRLRSSSDSSEIGSVAASPVRRILLCRLGGIGDVVHTLPLAKYLKEKYKNASIEYITSGEVSELLNKYCSFIDRTWVFNRQNKNKIASEITNTSLKIDYFFNLHSSLSFFFFNLFYIHARKYFHYKKNNNFHAVVNFAKTYDPAISALELEYKTLTVDNFPELLNKYELKENKYICIVPGVGKVRLHRAWTIESWAELTEKYLRMQNDFKVVYLGGDDENKLIGFLPEHEGKIVNLIGKLNLRDTTKIISASAQLISCDTGMLHIACALSKNVIGLFGPTLTKRSGPYTGTYKVFFGKDCRCVGGFKDLKKCRISKTYSGECMRSISVDDVLAQLIPSLVSL